MYKNIIVPKQIPNIEQLYKEKLAIFCNKKKKFIASKI